MKSQNSYFMIKIQNKWASPAFWSLIDLSIKKVNNLNYILKYLLLQTIYKKFNQNFFFIIVRTCLWFDIETIILTLHYIRIIIKFDNII